MPDGPVSLAGSFPAHLFLIPNRQHTHCFCDSSVVNSGLQPLGDQGGKPRSQNRSWHKQERLAGGGKGPFLCLPFPRAVRHILAWALLPSKPLSPPLNSSGAPGLCMCGCGQSLLQPPREGRQHRCPRVTGERSRRRVTCSGPCSVAHVASGCAHRGLTLCPRCPLSVPPLQLGEL